MSKVLLEAFIKEVINEESKSQEDSDESSSEEIKTWGQLRTALKKLKAKKLSMAAFQDSIGLLSVSKGLNITKLIAIFSKPDLLKKYIARYYGLNGKSTEDNMFKIDPEISKLVDDKLETYFIASIAKDFNDKKKYPDFELIEDFNMTDELHKFIKKYVTDKAVIKKVTKTPKETPKETPKKLSPWENN